MNNDFVSYVNISASVSSTWHYTTGIFATLCLLCGSISNGLVIFVFVRYNTLHLHFIKLCKYLCNNRNSNLRQPRNFLLINLAVTDLGLILTNNILHTIASFNKQWLFGTKGSFVKI